MVETAIRERMARMRTTTVDLLQNLTLLAYGTLWLVSAVDSGGQVAEPTGTRPLFRCLDSISAQGAVFIGEVILLPSKWGFSPGARLGVSEHADDNDWLPFVPALTPRYRRISVATSKAGNSNRCATIVIMEW
ncbi:hypothetical protein M405DRAFT_896144 [Rhizopogon salebrosus TDB-379]|nr:hypothetical protein M405DRAFT_896144 [Rhizopogon salebrosus TDB-379]